MHPADPSTTETARQASLDALHLLDTAPEPVFDRLTRLTARLLGVPMALFSLVDSDRQWFKSRVGVAAAQTPREQAFCDHTIRESAPLVVEDAWSDTRFMDNPLVTGDPHIRFYAGVPVRTSDGHAIGTLCALDSRPRALGPEDLQTLQDLADIVTKEVQYRERLEVAHERLHASGAAIHDSESRFRSIYELASIGIALVAPNGGWLSVNAALCRIVGYTEQELLGLTFQDITHPDDVDADVHLLQRLQHGEIAQYQLEKRYVRKDGGVVWINLNVSCKRTAQGEPEYLVSVVKDIQAQKTAESAIREMNANLEQRVQARTAELHNTNSMLTGAVIQQRRAEAALREREAELRSVIENANDAYIALDERGVITAWNRQAEHTFGWSAAQAIGQRLSALIVPPAFAAAHDAGMQRFLDSGKSTMLDRRLELPGQRRDGSALTLEVRIAALNINGRRMFSAFLHDITERKQTEAQREYDAIHDALTGLPNRRALQEQLPVAQKRAQRARHALALLFIDLDGFKAVNDTWGHETGDLLLCSVARRLTAALRETDSVYRLAGDEFTVILDNLIHQGDAVRIAEKLILAVSQPMILDSKEVRVGASIGIALYGTGGEGSDTSAADLIREADHWMYQAKLAGRGQVRYRV